MRREVSRWPLRIAEERRQQVPLHVVDPIQRQPGCEREARRKLNADEQRADQAGPLGDRQPVELGELDLRARQRLLQHGHRSGQVVSTRQLRHDTAELGVDRDLRGDHARVHIQALDDGTGGLVARRLDGEDLRAVAHRRVDRLRASVGVVARFHGEFKRSRAGTGRADSDYWPRSCLTCRRMLGA
jgi:hypothetical protein